MSVFEGNILGWIKKIYIDLFFILYKNIYITQMKNKYKSSFHIKIFNVA